MNKIPKNGWIADLETMTCHNIDTSIVVFFEKNKNVFLPKIENIPIDIFDKWAKMKDVEKEKDKEKIISEAEDVFMSAFIESGIN